jgi:hypothetical protein
MYFYLHRRHRILVPEQDVHNPLQSLMLLGADIIATFQRGNMRFRAAPGPRLSSEPCVTRRRL